MIRIHRLDPDGTLAREEGMPSALPTAATPFWLEVTSPTSEELAALRTTLGLHELALEDALREGHPPKLEEFEDHVFFIVHAPEPGEEASTRKLAVFLAKHWVVSIVRMPLACVARVADRAARRPRRFVGSPERLAHALVDHTVDAFEASVDRMLDDAESLETRALEETEAETLVDILEKRRQVSSLLRTVRGQRDVCHALSRGQQTFVSKKVRPYFRDVHDHCLRVHDLLEGAREAIGVSRDAFLSAQSHRMNQTMRVLTVIATIMMPLGVIAGIFGMNFDAIPGLHSPHGFWITMGAMGIGSALMLVWFRRRGWV